MIDADLGLSFLWPKHHNLNHALDILRRKGPTDNYETGLGESLHPQVKTDYGRSSHQPETTDEQVTYTLSKYSYSYTDTCLIT